MDVTLSSHSIKFVKRTKLIRFIKRWLSTGRTTELLVHSIVEGEFVVLVIFKKKKREAKLMLGRIFFIQSTLARTVFGPLSVRRCRRPRRASWGHFRHYEQVRVSKAEPFHGQKHPKAQKVEKEQRSTGHKSADRRVLAGGKIGIPSCRFPNSRFFASAWRGRKGSELSCVGPSVRFRTIYYSPIRCIAHFFPFDLSLNYYYH